MNILKNLFPNMQLQKEYPIKPENKKSLIERKVYDMKYIEDTFTVFESDKSIQELRSKCHKLDYFSFEFNDDSKVLDFGLGVGQNTMWAKNKYGFDINKGLYPQLKEKGFIMFNTTEEIPNNFFDEILVSQVLEHLDNPMETLKMLNTKLKVGGKIRIVVPNLVYDLYYQNNINQDYDSGHLFGWSHRELNHLLNRCGFHNIHNALIYKRGEVKLKFISYVSLQLYRLLTKITGRITGDLDVFVVSEKVQH